jgi:hypothetical protein
VAEAHWFHVREVPSAVFKHCSSEHELRVGPTPICS